MCYFWKYARVVDLSLQACSSVTHEGLSVIGECCSSGRYSSLNLLVLVLVFDVLSLSQVGVTFNVLDLNAILSFPSSPLSSTCSSSDPVFHFKQLIPAAFVVVHVVY